ncbi:hypothetical protein Kpho02_65920 [Kitasatospora phosalacinea]|uniref:SnoaL-like domain-containing protein n=1 Tax=Kitasatospora phosalacinea TaxID=2065 RepID=A0A9W6QDR4_9ACTN|nr:DMT family transporter [Kitasatospora phosalacinea]GLW74294.1 hypothetical protein Kpho02_65920 [Kitasatospora phosalacinea]
MSTGVVGTGTADSGPAPSPASTGATNTGAADNNAADTGPADSGARTDAAARHPALPGRAVRVLSVPLMVVAGGLLAVQSEVNGRLAAGLGAGPRAGIAAGAVSVGVGLLALLAATPLVPALRRGAAGFAVALRERRLRPRDAVGGVLGACFVASQGLAAPVVGVALFSVAVTAGQACSALLVDHVGLGPAGRRAVDGSRVAATALAVAAAGLGAGERLVAGVAWTTVLVTAVPLAAGAGLSVQQALNGRVARVVGPWAATLGNTAVGLVTLLLALAAGMFVTGRLDGVPDDPVLYVGGLLGLAFVALVSWLARVHGVLVLGLCVVAGQVLTAGAVQAALPPGPAAPTGPVPVALTLTGVLVALRRGAHRRGPVPGGRGVAEPAVRRPAAGGLVEDSDARRLALRMHEAFNARDVAAADGIFAPDFHSHPLRGGVDAVKAAWTAMFAADPEVRTVVEDVLVDGDRVALRSTVHRGGGTAGAGTTVLEVFRVAGGRIAELWGATAADRSPR